MMPKYNQTRLLQQTFKVKQTEIASRLIKGFSKIVQEVVQKVV